MRKIFKIWLCLCVLSLSCFSGLYAQEDRLSISVQQDGDVYIHHGERLPSGYGFNIYRQQSDGEYIKLNKELVRPVATGPELVRQIGSPLYRMLQEDLETASATETLLKLKSDRRLSLMLSFSYPAVAEALGFLFIDHNAPAMSQLTYRLELVNSRDEPTGEEVLATASAAPLHIKAPENLELKMEGNLLLASWQYPYTDRPELVSGFYLYRESLDGKVKERLNKGLILLTSDESFSYAAKLPPDGSTYRFYVKAVDITGQESPSSQELRFTISDIVPPFKVKNVRTHVLPNGLVELSWPTSVEADAAGYHIYRAPRSVDPYKRLNPELLPLLQTVFVDSTAMPGNKYMYTVTAVDSLGNESAKSLPASALLEDHEAPDTPGGLEARFDEADNSVVLSWKESGAQDLRSYMLLRRRKENGQYGPFSQLNDSTLRELRFRDKGLARNDFPAGSFFQFGVVAIDSATNFSDTTFILFQIPDLQPPPAPTFFRASNQDGYRVNLNWNASPAKDVTAYRLYRNDSLLALLSYSERYYRDKEVEKGREYIYRLTAMDSLGNESTALGDTLFMRDKNPPASVRNLQAAETAEGVRLRWEGVPSEDLAAYKIYRSEIPTGVYAPVRELAAGEFSWTDPEGTAGLWYKIIAEDSSGNKSKWSRPAQALRVQ